MAIEHKLLKRRPGLARLFQQCGMAVLPLTVTRGRSMLQPHGHDVCEAVLLRSGELAHEIAAYTVRTRPGCLDIIPAQQRHRYEVLSDRAEIINLHFDPQATALQHGATAATLFGPDAGIAQLRLQRTARIWQLIDEIVYEQRTQHFGWQQSLTLLMQQFLHHCARALHAGSVSWFGDDGQRSSRSRMNTLLQHIDASPQLHWTLTRMADELGVSREQTCRRFQQRCGCTPLQYLRQRRMNLCMNLCKHGHTVEQAALKAGFANYQACYRAFVQVKGSSPRQALAQD